MNLETFTHLDEQVRPILEEKLDCYIIVGYSADNKDLVWCRNRLDRMTSNSLIQGMEDVIKSMSKPDYVSVIEMLDGDN
jgi:hypothetical protein